MKFVCPLSQKLNRDHKRHGSVTVLLVVLLPVLFILSSYAINITYIEAVTADVQIATDVAVQAAGRAYAESGDEAQALAAAQDAVARNPVSGNTIPITAADLDFGISQRKSINEGYAFKEVASGEKGNAVRLTTRSLNQSTTELIKPIFPTMGVNIAIRPSTTAISTQSTMDVALVIDRSGSMAYASDEVTNPSVNPAAAPSGWAYGDAVPPNSRWLDLVAAVQAFNQYLDDSPQNEQLSLSTYSDTTSTDEKLTFKYNNVISELDDISKDFYGGATAIGMGMQEGLAAINDTSVARSYAVKVMIVLTDGIHNTGTDPENIVSQVQGSGATLFAITFSNEADQARMKSLAESCGGSHFHAVDAAQLTQAFENIAKRLPSLMTL